MDRRGFLKLAALLPIATEIIKKAITEREEVLDEQLDWDDPIILDTQTASAVMTTSVGDGSWLMYAPSRTRIGEYEVVGTVKALECYPNFDVQIRTGHCKEGD